MTSKYKAGKYPLIDQGISLQSVSYQEYVHSYMELF